MGGATLFGWTGATPGKGGGVGDGVRLCMALCHGLRSWARGGGGGEGEAGWGGVGRVGWRDDDARAMGVAVGWAPPPPLSLNVASGGSAARVRKCDAAVAADSTGSGGDGGA